MKISDTGLLLIENQEGFIPVRYPDGFGNETIGFGTTNSVVNPLPERVTRTQAEDLVIYYLEKAIYPAIEATGCSLNQNQFDGECDLGYNCGPAVFSEDWSMGKALRAHDLTAASKDFMLYDEANGEVISDLVRRREADQDLFDKKEAIPEERYHLNRFIDKDWDSPFGKLNERREVEKYNGARDKPEKYEKYLKEILEPRMKWLAERLANEVIHHRNGDWTEYWAGWRYQQLHGRAIGKEYPKDPK